MDNLDFQVKFTHGRSSISDKFSSPNLIGWWELTCEERWLGSKEENCKHPIFLNKNKYKLPKMSWCIYRWRIFIWLYWPYEINSALTCTTMCQLGYIDLRSNSGIIEGDSWEITIYFTLFYAWDHNYLTIRINISKMILTDRTRL